MAFQALIQLFQASSQPIQAPNWLSGLTSALLDLNSAQTDGQTDERTNESPPVFYRTLSPSGPLPKKRKKERKRNRSPKGNMWSAIPVALLCMIVNLSEGRQGSGPEGDEVL